MTHYYEININVIPKLRLRKIIFFSVLQFSVIGTGKMIGSEALQWSGFVTILLLIVISAIGKIVENIEKTRGLTIEEARKFLDELETGCIPEEEAQ